MKAHRIVVTNMDYQRLTQLLAEQRGGKNGITEKLNNLAGELGRAKLVDSEKVSPDVVTMNTVLEFTDLDKNTSKRLKLVYPRQADITKGYVSIMAPIGTALLGYRKGDIVEWEVPAGRKKFLIKEIIYQPEANGEYLI